MKTDQKSLLLFIGILLAGVLLTFQSSAQGFQGIATYKSDRDMSNFQFHGEGMSPDMAEKMKAQLKKQFQKEFELKFNLTESTWAEAESLNSGAARASSGGMEIAISFGGGSTYKNTESKTTVQQTESFSKMYLISDELEEREWEMTGKSKKIGEYTAYEAIYQNIREVQTLSMSDEGKSNETSMDTVNVTVWYTPDIPVPHGPEDYWGLPGLILELNDGNVTYLCSKIVLNPEKPIEIEEPKKGKKITAEEFEKLSQEMAQKMMKKFSGGNDDGEENEVVIRFGN